jgi:tetratricopeptide (TPR) repeat protein
MIAAAPDKSRINPMAYYYLGYFAEKLGRAPKASEYYALATKMPPDYVFPFQYEMIEVFRQAMESNPRDARAPYYLGNLLFDWQPEEAARMWERSASLDPSFPIVQRNLAVAYSHRKDGIERALASLEKAVSLEPKYPLHFFELDELYEGAGIAPGKRLALLEQNHNVVAGRDDALAREVALKVVMGKYDDAIHLMTGRRFSVWEGGNLNVADDWTNAHLLRGQQLFAARRHEQALADFQAATRIPDNLPSERIGGGEAEAAYWIGRVHEAMGNQEQARQFWMKAAAAEGRRFPLNGVQLYHKALALQKLGQSDKAKEIFQGLVKSGSAELQPSEQRPRARLGQAHFVAGLGYLRLGDKEKAKQEFIRALEIHPAHAGAKATLARLE